MPKVMVNAQGKLASLTVDLGSRVTKGQVLGSLDVAQKQLELQAAELSAGEAEEGRRSLPELVAGKAAPRPTTMRSTSTTRTQKVKVDQIRQQLRDAQVIAP
jgi:membrane fusion protein (multidrug efflux system)